MIEESRWRNIDGLKWYPWVGEDYFNVPQEHRLLILGESHYLDPDNLEVSTKRHDDPQFSRLVIQEQGVTIYDDCPPTWPNLGKVLFYKSTYKRDVFWNSVSFFNLVQHPMKSIKKRPTAHDYRTGWKVFSEVVNLLQPSVCLVVGTSSANYLQKGLSSSNIIASKPRYMVKLNRAYAKTSLLNFKNGLDVKMYFIKHTSHHISFDQWNEYLNQHLSGTLDWYLNQFNRKSIHEATV